VEGVVKAKPGKVVEQGKTKVGTEDAEKVKETGGPGRSKKGSKTPYRVEKDKRLEEDGRREDIGKDLH